MSGIGRNPISQTKFNMSTFTWLDTSEKERRRILDVISLFRDKDTRDELGIGAVRDAFADLLFPGTSTIQTRARYFLFIPWIYLNLEAKQTPSREVAAKARSKEVEVMSALLRRGSTEGLIGRLAKANLKRMPSAIYWQGLAAWGMRLFPATQSVYHRSLDAYYEAGRQVRHLRHENQGDDGEVGELQLRGLHNWRPGIKSLCPPTFPSEATFDLTVDEADYLRERILSSQSGSLLAFLVSETNSPDRVAFPWQHSDWARFSPYLQEQLNHARHFSLVIHGASLLYNLMLAEQACQTLSTERQVQVDQYRELLASWAAEMADSEIVLAGWDWECRFWEIVSLVNPHISGFTQQFVNRWLFLSLNDPAGVSDSRSARDLIRQRERRLKGKLSRLDNARSLELWNGAAGTGRLVYRWGVAQTMLIDIMEGLKRA
jgi:hypothetical protein